jgi:hypothetical protein
VKKQIVAERDLKNRTVLAPENDVREGQSHGRIELHEVGFELEITIIEFSVTVRKLSTRQERNMSGNMNDFLLNIIRSFKADAAISFKAVAATAMELLNCNFKAENTKLAKTFIRE